MMTVKQTSSLRWFQRSLLVAGAIVAAVLLRSVGTGAQMAAGTLDPTFGTGGVVAGGGTGALAMVLQGDGKIVVAGESNRDFAVSRYLPDGSLDSTFGTGGTVTTTFADPSVPLQDYDQANALALLPDGKLVAAGLARGGPAGTDFGLVRYLPDGTLDNTFGVGGKVITTFDAVLFEFVTAMVLQPDGKLVAAGSTGLLVARYNPDGALDPSFGVGGKFINRETGGAGRAVVLQPDGKLVVGSWSPTTSDFILTRLNPDGSVDASFGTGGAAATDFGGYAGLAALVLQGDGKLIAAGGTPPGAAGSGTTLDFLLARFNPDGSLDSTFGTGGKVTTDVAFGSVDGANALALQPDGKFIAAGFVYPAFNAPALFALARYNPDGTLDGTFGNFGRVVTTYFGRSAFVNALALQPDGRLVAAGSFGYPAGSFGYPADPAAYAAGVAMARYLPGAEACVVDGLALHPDSQWAFAATTGMPESPDRTAIGGAHLTSPEARLNPTVFRRLRDEVLLRSPAGRRYGALYARHSPEVVKLMLIDAALRSALLNGLLAWQAHAEALVAGHSVTVSAEQARAVDVVVDRLAQVGSPRLRQAIDAERRARPPGLTFAEALLRAIGR